LYNGKAVCIAGNLEEENFLQKALENVAAVFLVLPALQTLSLKEFATRFIETAEAKGVTHIVNISNCTLKRFGQWTALLEFENYLNEARQTVHIKHLRCANFFENLNWGIHSPYGPNIKLPYISSFEIAHVAANHLQQRDFKNISVDELMGKKEYSMQDFAEMLGVTYQQQPAPPEYDTFFEAFNTGQYELVQRTAENTSTCNDERFSLEYFLQHHFNKAILKS
jgi:hypothetical protein